MALSKTPAEMAKYMVDTAVKTIADEALDNVTVADAHDAVSIACLNKVEYWIAVETEVAALKKNLTPNP